MTVIAGAGAAAGATTGCAASRACEARLAAVGDSDRAGDEPVEQRVRPVGPALELGMELAGHEPGMVAQLDDLDEPAVGRLAGQDHPGRLEGLAVAVVDLEPVAVALVDELLAVDRGCLRAGRQAGRVEPEPHRPALVLELALVGHEVDDLVLGELVELGRVSVRRPEDVAGQLDDRALEAEAQPEVRDPAVAGVLRGEDLALDPAVAEPTRDEDPGDPGEGRGRVLRGERLGVDPADPDVDPVRPGGVADRLGHAHVGVGQLDVLADEADLEGRLGSLDELDQGRPGGEVGRSGDLRQAQVADDQVAQAGRLELERDLVDRVGRHGRDDRFGRDVGEQGDLLADLVADRVVRAEHDDVGLDADPAQLLDRVLGRLRLELAGRGQRREERHVDVQDVAPADVLAHLADRLEERQALDVADGPADLDDHHVGPAVAGQALDPLLDLVGDVGNDLDRPAEVVAAALLGDDRLVDPAGRDVARLAQVLVDEPLVVAQVEVGLRPVVGHEDLAVLVRRHRPGVDVDVRVELEDRDVEAACLEEPADAGGGDALAQRGGHASGHKDILRHGSGPPGVFPMLSERRPGGNQTGRAWAPPDGQLRGSPERPARVGRGPQRGPRPLAPGSPPIQQSRWYEARSCQLATTSTLASQQSGR